MNRLVHLKKSVFDQLTKEIDELWAKEAEERITDFRSGREKAISGEEVYKSMQLILQFPEAWSPFSKNTRRSLQGRATHIS